MSRFIKIQNMGDQSSTQGYRQTKGVSSKSNRKRYVKQLVILLFGTVSFSVGVGLLTSVGLLVWKDRYDRQRLLDNRSQNFVMYNDLVSQNSNVSVNTDDLLPQTDDLDFDFIPSVTEDQKITPIANTTVLEIPVLGIEVPILEGIDTQTLSKAVGHFEGTGALGKGNYCIAGHSSEVYSCVFNDLKNAELGMQVLITNANGVCYSYFITDMFVVEPTDLWVLDDSKDSRLTMVTCTEGGTRRRVVVALLMTEEEYEEYSYRVSKEKRLDIVNYPAQISDIEVSKYFEEVHSE